MAQTDDIFDLNDALRQLFVAHGVMARRQDDGIILTESGMRAVAVITQVNERPNTLSLELEVRFEFTPGRIIIEGFAGVGATKNEAAADAFQNFVLNSFHVFLAAFFSPRGADPDAEAQTSVVEWLIGGQPRAVALGDLGIRGKPPVETEQLLAVTDRFIQLLCRRPMGPETQWVRLYYGQAKSKMLACEVRLDNEVWNAMQSEAKALGWPAGKDFYSVRLFLIILGASESQSFLTLGSPAPEASRSSAKNRSWRFWRR